MEENWNVRGLGVVHGFTVCTVLIPENYKNLDVCRIAGGFRFQARRGGQKKYTLLYSLLGNIRTSVPGYP